MITHFFVSRQAVATSQRCNGRLRISEKTDISQDSLDGICNVAKINVSAFLFRALCLRSQVLSHRVRSAVCVCAFRDVALPNDFNELGSRAPMFVRECVSRDLPVKEVLCTRGGGCTATDFRRVQLTVQWNVLPFRIDRVAPGVRRQRSIATAVLPHSFLAT